MEDPTDGVYYMAHHAFLSGSWGGVHGWGAYNKSHGISVRCIKE